MIQDKYWTKYSHKNMYIEPRGKGRKLMSKLYAFSQRVTEHS